MCHTFLKCKHFQLIFVCFKVATPKRTFYLTGETREVVDEWLRGMSVGMHVLRGH